MSLSNLSENTSLDFSPKATIVPPPSCPLSFRYVAARPSDILKLYDSGLTVRGRRIFIESHGNSPYEEHTHKAFVRAYNDMQHLMFS